MTIFLDIIYDTRARNNVGKGAATFIRSVMTSNYPAHTLPLYAVLDYGNGRNPVVCSCATKLFGMLVHNINGRQFFPSHTQCKLSNDAPQRAPAYVTLTHNPTTLPLTNRVAPTFVVEPMTDERSRDVMAAQRVTVCHTNVYAHLEIEDALFFVNRMEALLMFGVSKMNLNYMPIPGETTDDNEFSTSQRSRRGRHFLYKVFDYYTRKGTLTVSRLKPSLVEGGFGSVKTSSRRKVSHTPS